MQDQQGSGYLQRVLGSMVHFKEHCILECQAPSMLPWLRFQEIQGQHRLRRKLLRDSRIVGTEMRLAVVMSDPQRAQRLAGPVVQRNDQSSTISG